MKQSSAIIVAKKFRSVLEQEGIHIESMILFGSLARKEETIDSDIDIAVVCKPFLPHRMDEMGRLSYIANTLDTRIETITLHPEDLENKYSTLVQEIKRDGIPV